MPPPEWFARFWLAWIATGIAVEAWALRHPGEGRTLCEGWRGTIMRTRAGRLATAGFVCWLGVHLLAGSAALAAVPGPGGENTGPDDLDLAPAL